MIASYTSQLPSKLWHDDCMQAVRPVDLARNRGTDAVLMDGAAAAIRSDAEVDAALAFSSEDED
jgi:hypothetical protein